MKNQDQRMRINKMRNKYFTKQDVFEILEIILLAAFSVGMIYMLTVIFWSYQ